MKSKNYWIPVASIVPFLLTLYFESLDVPITTFGPKQFILLFLVLAATVILVWRWFVIMPVTNLINTINRAIHGDFRARFSCQNENTLFRPISRSFNQFMAMMEQQTEELAKNRHLQNQLYENEKIYRSALELTCERVFEADLTHNKLVYGQESYNRHFPFLKTELYDEIIYSIYENAIYEEDAKTFLNTFSRNALMEKLSDGSSTEINLEYREKTVNGEIKWRAATLIHMTNHSDANLKVIGYVKDIDERKRNELEIIKLSQKDGLTGLYNKKFTQSLSESYLTGEGCKSNNAVIMLDIDNFKGINDTLGHLEGDAALVKVAEKLQTVFRSTDIIGRIGGDEFFVLVKDYTSIDMLTEKLERLCESFKEIHLGPKEDFPISGSVGVSLFPQDGKTYTELFVKSDTALYYAKQHGKDCYYICGGRFGGRKTDGQTESAAV